MKILSLLLLITAAKASLTPELRQKLRSYLAGLESIDHAIERRTSGYVVEMLFVVDNYAYAKYEAEESSKEAAMTSLKSDIAYFLKEINKAMASFAPTEIVISMNKLIIFHDGYSAIYNRSRDINENYDHHKLHSDKALNAFDDWLELKEYKKIFNYDLACLWTGYDLFKNISSGAAAGYAHTPGVCTTNVATSVVEYSGLYDVVGTTAHEVAHNLGVHHDNLTEPQGHIMAAIGSSTSPGRWTFSSESKEYLANYLDNLADDCLLSQDSSPVSLPTDGSITATLADPEAMCRRAHGKDSFLCDNNMKGDSMCQSFDCHTPGDDGRDMCTSTYPNDGMVCGSGRRCNRGKCEAVPSLSGESLNDDCLWGDLKRWTLNYDEQVLTGSCADMIAVLGKFKICDQFKDKCCKTCEDWTEADSAAADKADWCESLTARECYPKHNADTCPATCAKFNTGIEGCQYGDKQAYCTTLDKDSQCYANDEACCATCAKIKAKVASSDPTCQYGDHNVESCSKIEDGIQCYGNTELCCQSCRKFVTHPDIAGCEYGDKNTGCPGFGVSWGLPGLCSQYKDTCCVTCNGFTPQKRGVAATVTEDGAVVRPQQKFILAPQKRRYLAPDSLLVDRKGEVSTPELIHTLRMRLHDEREQKEAEMKKRRMMTIRF